MSDNQAQGISSKLDRILSILENDESIGHEGLVSKVNRNEKKLDEFLVRERIYKTKAATWGAVAGAIVALIGMGAKAIAVKLMTIVF